MKKFDKNPPAFIKGAYKRVPKQHEKVVKHQRACPPHRYPFQTAHYESERSQVLERGETQLLSTRRGKYRSQGTI